LQHVHVAYIGIVWPMTAFFFDDVPSVPKFVAWYVGVLNQRVLDVRLLL
jgi:hypothetical protein